MKKLRVSMVFMPQGINKVWAIKERRNGLSQHYVLNYRNRSDYWPANWTINKCGIARRFSKLHYLACHSPDPVAIKWRKTYNTFMSKHFANNGKGSTRFVNKHTYHSWL